MNQPSKRVRQRQEQLNSTAFVPDDLLPLATTCGICWQDGGTEAAIDDAEEFEYCFPRQPVTHENAKRIVREVLSRWAHRWHATFVVAEQHAEAQFAAREQDHADRNRIDAILAGRTMTGARS